jgi:hypothetical protein
MKFVDEAVIEVIAGKGGDGFFHFSSGITLAFANVAFTEVHRE